MKPQGSLSPIQFEIMAVAWDKGSRGATVTEVWQQISAERTVIRSTVQNLVERLATRGWLVRKRLKSGLFFRAAVPREDVEQQVMEEFIDGFFGGSATHLVSGLLGSGKINKQDIARLRRLLDEADTEGQRGS